jgi:hypothetical protein
MLKLPIRGLAVALLTVGLLYSCSNNGGSPTAPNAIHQGGARWTSSQCGVSMYLEGLYPVLLSWRDSLQTDSLHLNMPPDPAAAHSVTEHVSALVPVLQQWQGAINHSVGSSLLSALPDFNPDSILAENYTEQHLAPTLTGWETALETHHGSAFLMNLPVLVPDTTPPVIDCPRDTTVGCAHDSLAFTFKVTAADECDENPTVTTVPASGSFFKVGPTLVTVTAKDRSGNTSTCTFTVNVTPGSEATVKDVTASPHTLWPPNHKLVNVAIHVDVESDCPSNNDITCKVLEVRSNESDNGTGDGNTSPDWVITDDGKLKLRAERSGNGSGRVYSIHVQCDSDSGTVDDRWIDVTVPHDQGHGHH